MNDRRWWAVTVAVLAAVALTGVAAAIWGGNDNAKSSARVTVLSTTSTTSTSTPTATTPTTALAATTTAPTVPIPSTSRPPSSATTRPRVTVPTAVAVVSARSGGGSGEIVLDWNAVTAATGYRVLRADAPGGPFVVAADFDITNGKTTIAADVVNLWSQQHSYVPARGAVGAPDRSPSFEYVEAEPGHTQRYFRIVAYNAAGAAPASATVCGAAPGYPAC